MGFSTETNLIIQALRDLAEEHGFAFRTERPVFAHRGRHSERIDVVFSLSSDRAVIWFEIDSHPDRAAHNRLKVFGDILTLSSIPVVSPAVHHGRAATKPHTYPAELLTHGFIMPPRFLDAISVDNSSFEAITSRLREWIQKLFFTLSTAPEFGTVFDIAEYYQPLIGNLSLHVAVAHLEAHSELAWFLVANRRLDEERAACLSIALARMLQRAGYYSEGRHHIRLFRDRLRNSSSLSSVTKDDARTIEFLLNQPVFENGAALDYLSLAYSQSRETYNKSRFLWRKAEAHIANGKIHDAEYIVESYLSLMNGSLTAQANVALLRVLASILLRRGDPRESAHKYYQLERFLLAQNSGSPDGTAHGVVASLYLKAISASFCGNKYASELLPEIDSFRNNVGIPRMADGIRDINAIFPPSESTIHPVTRSSDTRTLSALLARGRRESLDRLCAIVDIVCD